MSTRFVFVPFNTHLLGDLAAVKASLSELTKLEAAIVEEIKLEMLAINMQSIEVGLWRATFVVNEKLCLDTAEISKAFPFEDHPEMYISKYSEQLRLVSRKSRS